MERELQNLRRRHEILRLRREIEQMERNEAAGNQVGAAPAAQAVMYVKFISKTLNMLL